MIHRRRLWVWMLPVVVALLLTLSGTAAARETAYSIVQQDITTELMADGQARVTEMIRCQVHADLDDLVFLLPYEPEQTIEIIEISVADTITGLEKALFVAAVPAEAGSNQVKSMTWDRSDTGRQTEIRLHLFLKASTVLTVNLVYRIQPIVYRHADVAFLQRRFFQQPAGCDIQAISLRLSFPEPVQTESLWYLPSSMTSFAAEMDRDNRLIFTAEQLAAGHYLDLTLLAPLSLFGKAPPAAQPLPAETLKDQAVARDMALYRQSDWQARACSGVFILIGLAAVLFIAVYWIYDREGVMIDRQRYLRDVPHACPPVVLALLLRRKRPARLMMAILMNLVHQQLITLEGTVFTRTAEPGDPERLSASERFLLHWFFDELATNGSLSIAQVRGYAKNDETNEAFRKQYQAFRHLLDHELSDNGLLDRKKTIKGRLIACIAALLYVLLAVSLTVFLQAGSGLLLLVPACGFLLYSGTLRRLTSRGRDRYSEGQAMARYLRKITRILPYPDAEKQRQLLPYTMALGLIQSYLKALPQIWNSRQIQAQFAVFGIGRTTLPVKNQLDRLAADLRAMESMLAASLLLSERIHL